MPTTSTPTAAADAAREQRNRWLAALLAEAAGGSAKAFEAFHDTTCVMAQGVARRTVAVDAVDDVLVDPHFQAWQQAARFDAERGSAASWLLAILRSRALDLLRSRAGARLCDVRRGKRRRARGLTPRPRGAAGHHPP